MLFSRGRRGPTSGARSEGKEFSESEAHRGDPGKFGWIQIYRSSPQEVKISDANGKSDFVFAKSRRSQDRVLVRRRLFPKRRASLTSEDLAR